MSAKKTGPSKTARQRIIPERLLVENEVAVLLVLREDNQWHTAFQLEVAVATIKVDSSRSVQLGAGLRQLIDNGLIDIDQFRDTKTNRTANRYRLTEKGKNAADTFHNLFVILNS